MAFLAAATPSLASCGGALYAAQINAASSKLAQAKEVGADNLAAYEYYYATSHLTKAMSEAAEGDYSDAIDFAEVAQQYADKAIMLSREARGGAGR